jgi:hypothetical protein
VGYFAECCAYCERTREEIIQSGLTTSNEDVLRYVLVGDRQGYRQLSQHEMWALLCAPVDLPDGCVLYVHTCPMLQYDGFSDDEAVIEIELQSDGEYFIGNCPECGIAVRSRAVSRTV